MQIQQEVSLVLELFKITWEHKQQELLKEKTNKETQI
jgi:hypothetical protein